MAKRPLDRAPSVVRLATAGALLLSILGAASALGAAADPIATGSLKIQGNRLTLYADEQTTDADQTVNVGERARVRTCFGGSDTPCGSVFPGDPRVAGLVVRGDLRGPEIPQSIALETVPGGSFALPGFQQEGDYRLENIRLVEESTGQVLATAEPSLAILHVRQILLASATVRTLSLEELRQRGITLSAENFQAFNFAVGFAFGDQIVQIDLPIVYSGFGTVQPLDKPTVHLDGLPENVAHVVERWQPPMIVPFRLEQEETEALRAGEEEDEELRLPLFGAIVLPGTVSYLNQFFEARLIVANGAPSGSQAFLGQIGGTLRLPGGNVLRLVQSDPPVAPGTAVPVIGVTGSRTLAPGEQGSAAWTVEGLVAGSYTLQMDVTADLVRPGREPFPLLSRIQAAIEVVDARFNLSFSHPDVVREGEEYTLYVTVTNLSRATQNLISVDLDQAHMTGAHRADPNDNLLRTIQTLTPGQSETLEYRLISDLDGKVVATTFQSTSAAGQGTIHLRTGVGELGIPLSPATLVLPRFSERLKKPYLASDDLHRAHNRFLGLAYSLAVAPAALTPAGLPRVIKTDVERRAIDFAQAGMRTYLHEPLLESVEVLTLDYLGNRTPLAEIDELRRGTGKGLAVGIELAKAMRQEQAARGLAADAFFDQFTSTTSYTAPYVAALLIPDGTPDSLQLVVQGAVDGVFGNLTGEAGTAGALRTLPYGEVLPVLRSSGESVTLPLALVGHVALDQELAIVVRNPGTQTARGDLLIVVPDADGGEDRRLSLAGVTVPSGGAVTIHVGAGIAHPQLVDEGTGAPVGGAPSERRVDRPPFRLIGAVQDFRLKEEGPDFFGNMIRPNRYGNGLLYLFNRPPVKEDAEDERNYRVRSSFNGLDSSGQPATGASEKLGSDAWVQDDGRTVAVRYALPISALIQPANGQPLLTHQHLLDTSGLHDAWGEALDPALPPPSLETAPVHLGGLVTGKVVRGTGEPVAGAKVQLIRPIQWETQTGEVVKLDFLGEMTTGADGAFFFDFIENPSWDKQVLPSFTLRATIPAGADPALQPEEVQEVSSTVRLQNRALRMNIALLGRGTVQGKVVYGDDGSPVASGTVRATSTLFNEEKSVVAKPDGTFRLPGVPVGPITITARDADGRVVYATVGVANPGDTVEVNLRMPRVVPGFGTVLGTVVGATTGEPVAGARVSIYTQGAALDSQETDSLGRYRFDRVPEGKVTLQAANWTVSRVPILTDLILAAGETQEITLRLPQGASRAVTGSVYFHDPVTNTNVPIQGAVAFIAGPGNFAYTDAAGRYRIEGVPVQGATESYVVKAIDFSRKLEGSVNLPPVLDVSADEIAAQNIVLAQMSGGVDGVVLDPLGRPLGSAEVVIYPYGTTTSKPDGSFSFDNLPLSTHVVVAHLGDGLTAGRVGYIGDAPATIVYGGHRPFVTLRLRGAGIVRIKTRTATATGVLTPIYYKPTYYSSLEYAIRKKGSYIESSTDPNGNLELILPVGPYEVVAYNPFHGIQTLTGVIDYAGQVINHDVVFEDAATVTGTVVGVDGVTPVPGVEVVLEAAGLKGQKQTTDAQGTFRYDLVPKGRILVTAQGIAGNVERVGRTIGYVGTAGQTLDITVQMKAQGTVSGRVMENFNGTVRPLANAYYFLQEDTFPFRRIPEGEGTWRTTDAQGRFTVPHVYAGGVTVVARDSGQIGRLGSVRGELAFDWQSLQLAEITMTTSVGSLRLSVRNPVSGGPVADAQVKLSNNEATVTDADGIAFFDALPMGTYSLYAFFAPTGQSGRLAGVQLSSPGQQIVRTVYLDQRGDVRGTLWSDAAKTIAVGGGTIRLDGDTAGGRVSALATTSSEAGSLGRFEFQGIPEGSFLLEGAHPTTPQRASATATLTATSPVVDLNLVLEAIGDRYLRLFEKLKAGTSAVSLGTGVFSTRLTQAGAPPVYDFAQLAPVTGTNVFKFPNVLVARGGGFTAEELSGERRKSSASFSNFTSPGPVAGSGTQADPYQLTLSPKGVVRVSVRDAQGRPAVGANVTLSTSSGAFPSITGADGTVSFAAVPSGALNATASALATGTSGYAAATLTFDDDLIEMTVALAPAVAAHGTIYLPVPNDIWNGDVTLLVPAPAIIVELRDSKGRSQVVLTDDRGQHRFGGLPTGTYTINVRNNNGDQFASVSGNLAGPDGNDNAIPNLILDAAPPRLLTIAPPPGFEGVSRTAAVELVFSEPLLANVLPVNQGNPTSWFAVRSASGAAAPGTWTSSLDATGQQVVRFAPSAQYENSTFYSITVSGGSSGVRDRMGRPLTASGNVGANFKTSDTNGPAVIGSTPDLARPVDPSVPIRFDFSEAVRATDAQLDGDLLGDAAELYWQRDADGPGGAAPVWQRLPIVLYLTRSNFSLVVQAMQGVSLDGDTLQRRVVLTGLVDSYGNLMPVYDKTFRIYDAHAPHIDAVPFPLGVSDGQLLQGNRYTFAPQLSALDDVSGTAPGGDLDRVDYYLQDPTDPAHPVSASYSSKTLPFAYSFVAAYVGDGTTPRPFPVWVQAVDTSTNKSNVVLVNLVVLPNTKPRIETVGLTASVPVPGVPYAGSTLLATVDGIDDLDSSQLTLIAELWKEGGATFLATTTGRLVTRPATGWNDLPSQTFGFTLPLDTPEGTPIFVRARVIDPNAAVATQESAHVPVEDDAAAVQIDDFSVRLAGAPVTNLFIGEDFYLEIKAHDVETGIQQLEISLDRTDLFPGTLVATKVTGTTDLYRSATLTVPPGFTSPVPVAGKVRIADFGGNSVERTTPFSVGPERDPTAPVARWQLPWQGALWPSDYTSTVSPSLGAALLLRFYARDTNLDADGNPIPGRLVTVQLRGPVRNATTGAIEPASAWTNAVKVVGSEDLAGAVYQGLWRVPNGIPAGAEIPFEVRLIDSASTETITRVTMTAVPARRVYEGVLTSAGASDTMVAAAGNPDGPVFVLDGSTLSLLPQATAADGSRPVRHLPALFVYAGASTDTGSLVLRPTVLTAPEITSYDSAILYQPLELAIDNELGLSVASRIDMSKKGLLGSTSTRSMVLPGETGAAARAGGSHGGEGWSGSPSGGWNTTNLTLPGSLFDSLRDPRLPGGGGGSADANAGGTGGGVIRLLADSARVRLDGDLIANGGDGAGSSSGGGAGGAIRLTSSRLEGIGRIQASGGGGTNFNNNGGGGGGRIALSYRDLSPTFALGNQVEAAGGIDDAPVPSRADRRGGAGTVFVEVIDPSTGQPTPGRLLLKNPIEPARAGLTPLPGVGSGVVFSVVAIDATTAKIVLDVARVRGEAIGDRVALFMADGAPLGSFPIVAQARVADATALGGFRIHLTVAGSAAELAPAQAAIATGPVSFRGLSRLASVEAEASVRLVSDDDLLLGPDPVPVVNDRTAILLKRGARAALRGEAPVVTFTATPAPGSDLLLGATATVSWSVSDPLGLTSTKTEQTFAPTPVVTNIFDESLTAASGSATSLPVPLTAAPANVSYTVEARNTAGRVTRTSVAWPVPANQPPAGQVTLAAGTATPVKAGYPFTVVVPVTDRERLLKVTLTATGPLTPVSPLVQTATVTGTSAAPTFTINVASSADGTQPVVLSALIEDASGGSVNAPNLTVPVAANGAPSGTVGLAAGAPSRITPGQTTTILVHTEDADGIAKIDLHATAPAAVTQPEQSKTLSGNPIANDSTFALVAAAGAPAQTVSVTATITDRFGSAATTAPFTFQIVADLNNPAVSLTLSPDRGAGIYRSGEVINLTASATDNVAVTALQLLVNGATTSSSGAPVNYAFTIPPLTAATTYTIQATATDGEGNSGTASRTINAAPVPADLPPVVSFTCPTTGALLPSDYTTALSAAASDDLGVTAVRFYLGDATTPFATVNSTGMPLATTASTTFNLATVSGSTVRFRVEATDTVGQVTSQFVDVNLTAVVNLKADGQGTNSYAALANSIVALRSGTLTIDSPISVGGLIVLNGATLTHTATTVNTSPKSVQLTVNGPVYVACGGAIDASARGFAIGMTYPGHAVSNTVDSGGAHLGEGGSSGTPWETFGSVYAPIENGSGSFNGRGGGTVKIVTTDRLQVDGALRANGESQCRGGGGGSIWLRAATVAGSGAVEVKGGNATCGGNYSGGGGAIAVEYTTLDTATALAASLRAQGGSANTPGGAGTVYLLAQGQPLGDLTVDNGTVGSTPRTTFPSLGKGTAGAGSSGSTLVTGRSKAIPAYLTGHWVEVRNAGTGALKGTWRIQSIAADGLTVTLTGAQGETVNVAAGDLWQGVYRFARLTVRGNDRIASLDPIRVAGEQVIAGPVETDAIFADRLVVKNGATLTQRFTPSATAAESLAIEVRELVVESGAVIDVSARGYALGSTYPGAALSNATDSGGSHIGEGGTNGTPWETFGSVYYPRENGSGSYNGRGAGAVRIVASERSQIDGTIRANGEAQCRGGAGGSVWVKTGSLAGVGAIEAKGGNATCNGNYSGGGGAIAVEYSALESATTLLDHLSAQGGSTFATGGAGSVYLKGGGAPTYGHLIVDNGALGGHRRTVLPPLGKGTAQQGSGGSLLVTGRAKAIPAYFVGHWVEVRSGQSGALEGTWRIAAIGADGFSVTLASSSGEPVTVDPADSWLGVYRFDQHTVKGDVQVVSADPIRVAGEQVIAGPVETDAISADRLVIKAGATLTQRLTPSATAPESLAIEVRELVVEAGGVIDVTARGYGLGLTYPGALASNTSDSGGSHLGEGGTTGTVWETFGSVYFPRENGSSTFNGRGGGAVRIVAAERARIDGSIRANGEAQCRGGAGGSAWLKTAALAGVGTIEAKGGNATCNGNFSGGGGAIAVEYTSLEAATTLLDHLSAQGGSSFNAGGAGTVYLKGGSAPTYGHLIVDNGALGGHRRTVLPPFGKGTAQQGSGGAVLVTGKVKAIPPYFVGHWIEIREAQSGVLKGTWRVTEIGLDGVTVILAANPGDPATVQAGDSWQGVYRVDQHTVKGDVQVVSADPIRVAGELVIAGPVETDAISADRLVVKAGATLTQRLTPSATAPESLAIDVRELVVESGGLIDVTARGYGLGLTYPGALASNTVDSGGSHLGEGGTTGTVWETFGSVYSPRENGSSTFNGRGGGAVRIAASERAQVDGTIRANGEAQCRGGAGGSIWLKTAALSGTGTVEAKGGNATCNGNFSGGGGAIAVEFSTLGAGTSLLDHLSAQGGSAFNTGGAGTVYLKGGSAPTYGRLNVDNGALGGHRRTVLPALGGGTAQVGSAGAVLVTGRSKAIPAYFVGHWVEIRDGLSGVLEGTWRIAAIAADGLTATLASNAGEPLTVDPSDRWQGVYRFDQYAVLGDVQVVSPDPIRVYSDQVITGSVETDAIYADRLVVKPGAVLTQRFTPSSVAPESLNIEVRELIVESGGSIDVSGRGYGLGVTYPGHATSNTVDAGGSHLGEGGTSGTTWETFGSVTAPRENGSGSFNGRGGGAVRLLVAEKAQIDGTIRANGEAQCRGGGGGSVWLRAASLKGSGTLEAKGGSATCNGNFSGGGGAVAVEYGAIDPAATVIDHLNAQGGTAFNAGGTGTVFVKGPSATLGSLIVDNKLNAGNRRTVLPSLGRGIVQPGSSGGTLLTGRTANVPAYFVGSWVEVEGPDRFVKGLWKIAAVSGTTITLEPKATQPFTIAPGDRWRGLYRFDSVTVAATSVLVSTDSIVQLVPPLPAAAGVRVGGSKSADFEALYGNDQAPLWDKSAVTIAVGTLPGSYRIALAATAVSDPDGIYEVALASGGRTQTAAWTAEGALFYWSGTPGQRLYLVATDAHGRARRSAWLELPPLPAGGWNGQLDLAPAVNPLAVVGGADWLAIGDHGVWIYGLGAQPTDAVPPRLAEEEVHRLAAGDPQLFAATRGRLDVLDRASHAVAELPMLDGVSLVDLAPELAAQPVEALLLLSDQRDPLHPALRLAELTQPPGEAAILSLPGEQPLPPLAEPALVRTPDRLHLFGLKSDGAGVIYSWPDGVASEPLTAAPEVWDVPSGWRGLGLWAEGAVLLQGDTVRLLRAGASGWSEVAVIDLGTPATAAAVSDGRLVVVLPGEIVVYDIADPTAPTLVAHHPGSSYRQVTPLPNGEVLLWSPRMPVPPLRWNPALAVPGAGFDIVIQGLP